MKRLGLLVRIDEHSGLTHQTQEMLRWLKPEAVLVVEMAGERAPARGPQPVDACRGWPRARFFGDPGQTTPDAEQNIVHFLEQCDVVLSVETFYWPFLSIAARASGVERVLYANPELLSPREHPEHEADRYLWAARWQHEHPTVRGELLDWPTSPDLFDHAERWRSVPHLVHVRTPAMLDREGSEIVYEAAGFITQPCRILIYGSPETSQDWANEYVSVEHRRRPDDFRELYADADVMLCPRRYGALSLVMLEAAAAGVPSITTDALPQSGWFGEWPELLIPTGGQFMHGMKGNMAGVPVYTPHAYDLGYAIDRLLSTPGLLDDVTAGVTAWAIERSWPVLLDRWNVTLRGESTAALQADGITGT
jgi:hypothetical protein